MFCKWSSPVSFFCAEEELGSVGVGPGIGHGQQAGTAVLHGEIFVGELVAVNRLAAGAVVVGEITTLQK